MTIGRGLASSVSRQAVRSMSPATFAVIGPSQGFPYDVAESIAVFLLEGRL